MGSILNEFSENLIYLRLRLFSLFSSMYTPDKLTSYFSVVFIVSNKSPNFLLFCPWSVEELGVEVSKKICRILDGPNNGPISMVQIMVQSSWSK